jgi:hypothetical protein
VRSDRQCLHSLTCDTAFQPEIDFPAPETIADEV